MVCVIDADHYIDYEIMQSFKEIGLVKIHRSVASSENRRSHRQVAVTGECMPQARQSLHQPASEQLRIGRPVRRPGLAV